MTPMIDVVFLLLVFFVCASVGERPEDYLATDLAGRMEVDTAKEPPQPPEAFLPEIRVTIRRPQAEAGPEFRLNDRLLPGRAALIASLTALAAVDAASPVVLDVDDAATIGDFVDVYDVCRSLEFEHIDFAVAPLE